MTDDTLIETPDPDSTPEQPVPELIPRGPGVLLDLILGHFPEAQRYDDDFKAQAEVILFYTVAELSTAAFEVDSFRAETNPKFLAEAYNKEQGNPAYKEPGWAVFANWLVDAAGRSGTYYPLAETMLAENKAKLLEEEEKAREALSD